MPDEFTLNSQLNNINSMWKLITMIVERTSKMKSMHVFTVEILDCQKLYELFEILFSEREILTRFLKYPELMNK